MYRSIKNSNEKKVISPAIFGILIPEVNLSQNEPVVEVALATSEISEQPPLYIPNSREIQAMKLRVPPPGTSFSRDESPIFKV